MTKPDLKKSYVSKRIESIDTKELENILVSDKYKKAKKVIEENNDFMVDDDFMIDNNKKFSYYMKDLIKEKGMTIKRVIFLTGISESYGRQILDGKKTENRDLIIGLCISAGFTIKETNRALKLKGMQSLYAKSKRDAVIMIEINKGDKSIYDINQELEENNLEPLKTKSTSD